MRKSEDVILKKKSISSYELIMFNLLPVAGAGLIDRIIMHPVDTIATTQQDKRLTLSNTVRTVFKSKGLSGFYVGFSQPFWWSVPIRIATYSTYLGVRDSLQASTTLTSTSIALIAGASSGCIESIVMCPSDGARTRETCNRNNVNNRGFLSTYRGFLPLLARTSIENTIALAGNDYMLKHLPDEISSNAITPYCTGTIAGMFSQVFAGPVDTVKTHVMNDIAREKNIFEHLSILRSEKSFFQGTSTKIIRTGIGTGLMLGTITLISNWVKSKTEKNEDKNMAYERAL